MIELIRNTIVDYVDVDPKTIVPETRFIEDLNLNSYELVQIVGSLESELGITLPESELHNVQSIADVLELLKTHIS